MNPPTKPNSRRLLSIVTVCVFVAGCGSNRAALRIPGASLSFPQTITGFVAKQPLARAIDVQLPIDSRSKHYGEKVAGSRWEGCETDALWHDTASTILHERINQELVSSSMVDQSLSTSPLAERLTLKSEIYAFCSQARGFLIARVAGIAAVRFSLERNGSTVWEHKIERVVTDADPEYSGSQVAFLEQAMRVTMADSLRLVLRDLLRELESYGSKTHPQEELARKGAALMLRQKNDE